MDHIKCGCGRLRVTCGGAGCVCGASASPRIAGVMLHCRERRVRSMSRPLAHFCGRNSWSGYDGVSGVLMTTWDWFSAVWQALQPAFTIA
jgi:hypothetical protein